MLLLRFYVEIISLVYSSLLFRTLPQTLSKSKEQSRSQGPSQKGAGRKKWSVRGEPGGPRALPRASTSPRIDDSGKRGAAPNYVLS